MEVDAAFALISHAIDAGHAAHGYLIVGDVRGNAAELVRRLLFKLFPNERAQVESGSHPDVIVLEPQGKSRTIKVARGKEDERLGMRDGLVGPISVSSFSGGWKVGIIVSADRLQLEAANAFLKTLEEPPPKTMFFLLTDQPDAILPTIVSRSQRIDLQLPRESLADEDFERVADAFAERDAATLAEIFSELKDGVDNAEVPQVRKLFFKTLMGFVRQMMLGGKLPRYQAYRNIEAVEEAYRQSERYLGDEMVLSFLMDRIAFPAKETGGAA